MRQEFLPAKTSQTISLSSLSIVMNNFPVENEVKPSQVEKNDAFQTEAHSIFIRRLPSSTTKDALRMMIVWSNDLIDTEVLSDQPDNSEFCSAILRFKTQNGALEAKRVLDKKLNATNDSQASVEILYRDPLFTSRSYVPNVVPTAVPSSSTASAHPSLRQATKIPGTFETSQRMPQFNGLCTSIELPNPEDSILYQSLFSPQSPIGNHLNGRIRATGKSLIKKDSAVDDETRELLKDPVAYAEHGLSAPQRRQQTNPRTPISQMAGLALKTTNTMNSTIFTNYQHPQTSAPRALINSISSAPMNSGAPLINYQLVHQYFHRHNFPPVNPADHNPPCNTLYVGNLPIDTSEDELKAMFSKQRGYKRLCFRTKQNGPMCFVEFEDISFATKALHELYGQLLHNSVKGGIRLSFSKNPLGVRSGQSTTSSVPPNTAAIISPCINGSVINTYASIFGSTCGPPPGLVPSGLGQSRAGYPISMQPIATSSRYHGATTPHTGNYKRNGWIRPVFNGAVAAGGTSTIAPYGFPAHMMGR